MARYKLTDTGVYDSDRDVYIPFVEGNRHYEEYLVWLTEGSPVNTPDDSSWMDEL